MKRNSAPGGLRLLALAGLVLAVAALQHGPAPQAGEAGVVHRATVLTITGAIGPATADYVKRGLAGAHERGGALVVLKVDTPGGLDTAMRDIIRAIIASPVPVATYVAPSGARAASAGTYIVYASHVAAMAPATNLGAATPVQLGGLPSLPQKQPLGPRKKDAREEADSADDDETPDDDAAPAADAMTKKMVNDAAAYIRGLARMRGRNEDWAETAVRDGASLTAEDALRENVIDFVAADERILLEKINGRVINIQGVEITLDTTRMGLDYVEPDWRTELLGVIASPNVAYVLMLLGIYGMFFELANPGAIVPGVVGGICLIVAMFGLQMLPLNYAGLALILLGIAFMIGELFVPSFGALGIGGVVAFAIGSVILFDAETQQFRVSLSIIAAVTALTAAFFLIAVRALFKAREGPVVSGREQLVGSLGKALDDFDGTGQIRVHGEIWNARAARPVMGGAEVKVVAMDGLTLEVEPAEEKSP